MTCPGKNLCCERDGFSRTIHPCTTEDRLVSLEQRVLELTKTINGLAAKLNNLQEEMAPKRKIKKRGMGNERIQIVC